MMTSSVGPFDRVMASVASLLRVEVLGLLSLGGMEGVLCGCQRSDFSSCRHPITDQSNRREEGVPLAHSLKGYSPSWPQEREAAVTSHPQSGSREG